MTETIAELSSSARGSAPSFLVPPLWLVGCGQTCRRDPCTSSKTILPSQAAPLQPSLLPPSRSDLSVSLPFLVSLKFLYLSCWPAFLFCTLPQHYTRMGRPIFSPKFLAAQSALSSSSASSSSLLDSATAQLSSSDPVPAVAKHAFEPQVRPSPAFAFATADPSLLNSTHHQADPPT